MCIGISSSCFLSFHHFNVKCSDETYQTMLKSVRLFRTPRYLNGVIALVLLVCTLFLFLGSQKSLNLSLSNTISKKEGSLKSTFDRCRNHDMDELCAPWDVEMDSWWTHHPEWEVVFENDFCFCFKQMANHTPEFKFLREVYNLQFSESTNCSNVRNQPMPQQGYGADTAALASWLRTGYQKGQSFQLVGTWKYAVSPDKSKQVCPSASAFCYFLPLGRCTDVVTSENNSARTLQANKKTPAMALSWLRIHATRPQQWLRKRIYDCMKERVSWESIHTPCVAMHVRRSDLANAFRPRKIFPISEYIEKVPDLKSKQILNVILVTDDADAIDEALKFHPEYNWIFLNRTRYRGSSAAWGVHMPTNDPVLEDVAIYATFQLARHCDTLVHSDSTFSLAIYDNMLSTRRNIARIQIQ